MLGEDDLRRAILQVLQHVAPEADTTGLDAERSFRDQIGLDSIDFLNFIVGLEDRLGVRIAEENYPQLSSLQGCVAYLQRPAAALTDPDNG